VTGTIAPVLLLLAAIVVAGELARRLHIVPRFASLAMLGRRAGAVLARRGVSDHLKERATRILAGRMMASSLTAGGILALVIAPVVLLLLIDGTLPLGVRAAFFDWQARGLLLSMSLIYVFARWRLGRRRLQPR
jgi:fumarate reductase subunit D